MRRKAFSLIELIIVVAMIGMLIALLLPAIQSAREAGRRAECASHLRQIGIALHGYEEVNKAFPPSCTITDTRADGSAHGIAYGDDTRVGPTGFGWGVYLLPFLEQSGLYHQFRLNEACWSPNNAEPAKAFVPVFICPSVTGGSNGFVVQKEGADNRHGVPLTRDDGSEIVFAHSHYAANAGINQPWGRSTAYCYDFDVPEPIAGAPDCIIDGPFYPNSRTTVKGVTDGLSHTIFFGERSSYMCHGTWVGVAPTAVVGPRLDLRPWPSENNAATDLVGVHSGPDVHDHPQVIIHAPNNPFGHTDQMWGEHGTPGCNVLLGDSSVRFISAFIAPDLFVALSTRNRGELISHVEE